MSVTDTPSNESQGPADATHADAGPPQVVLTPAGDVTSETPLLAEAPPAAAVAEIEPEASPSTDSQPPLSADAPPAGEPGAALAPDAANASATPREQGLSPAQTAARLAELFPELFGSTPKPIKLRIQVDIQQRAPGVFTKRVMSIFLSRHTTTTPYLKALVAQTQRYDLDGQPAGEIAAEHKQAATEELARRRQIVEERRAAERATRHPRPGRGPQRPGSESAPLGDNPITPVDAATPDRPPQATRQVPGRGPSGGFAADRRPRQDRPGRPGRPSEQPAGPRPLGRAEGHRGRPAEGQQRARQPQSTPHRAPSAQQNPAARGNTSGSDTHAQRDWAPVDPAQRERALLLRAWESSSLTKANFCALKRMTAAEFDAQLDQARQERSAARSA